VCLKYTMALFGVGKSYILVLPVTHHIRYTNDVADIDNECHDNGNSDETVK